MKPLILSFLTLADESNVTDEEILEYDEELQLSVVKQTREPAFDHLSLRTLTDTKTYNEGSDSDYSANYKASSCCPELQKKLHTQLSTKTITLSVEVSDEDHGPKMATLMLGTMTMTRTNMEASDSDKQ